MPHRLFDVQSWTFSVRCSPPSFSLVIIRKIVSPLGMQKRLFFNKLTLLIALLCFYQTLLAYELEWDQTKVEIELQPGETETQAEFNFTNKGKDTVHIDRIQTSCGCTGSILDQKEIEPGQSATIIGTFKAKNRKGLNHNRLQVFTKGKSTPVQTLHMLVQVPQLINANPTIVYWNRSTEKTARQIQIEIDERYLSEISAIEYNTELLSIKQDKDPSGTFDHILTVTPQSYDRRMRDSVIIKAEGENGLSTETKVYVFVQP